MKLTLTPAILALAIFSFSTANAEDKIIANFDDIQGPTWRAVNDRVMGGLSKGAPSVKNGVLTFKGVISLENNGGFSSARTAKKVMNLSAYDGLSIRVKPDSRKYRLTIESQKTPRFFQLQYWADLKLKPGVWQTVRVPFSKFYPTTFGRRLPRPRLDRKSINAIGFMLYDKKAGPFEIQLDSIVAYNGAAPKTPKTTSTSNTIVDIASKAGSFKTLLAAAKAAGLAPALSGPGPFTVFAPTDEAFAKIPAAKIKDLLRPENRNTLQAILKFHVVPGKAKLADVLGGPAFSTLNGQQLNVSADGARIKIGKANILTANISASNGIIHVIDTVLIPETRTIVEVASKAGSFKTLLAAAKAAGLVKLLSGDKAFTVFAPTDKAFSKLPNGLVASLLEPQNKPALIRLLTHHVVPGRVFAATAVKANEAKSAAGTPLNFNLVNGQLRVNDVQITATDISASNGTIHVVNRVLIPSGLKLTPKRNPVKQNSSLKSFVEASIEKGAPLFNDGNTEACRSIYETTANALLSFRSKDLCPSNRKALESALKRHSDDSRAHAWRLRKALDLVLADHKNRKASTVH